MPGIRELLSQGQLAAALAEATSAVKARPTDMQLRTTLFELLCFAGEWERAEKQLEVIAHQDAKTAIGVQAYHNNIRAERARERLFTEGLKPHFLIAPPAYVALHLEALNRIREGSLPEARALLDRAEDERPALAGKIDGQPFTDFRDVNDLTGPVLEVIVQDNYTWVPFEQIRQIELREPKQLRDLLWMMARIETEAVSGEVFIPALYAGSGRHADDQVRLGRVTAYRQLSDELYAAAGMRVFLVDDEEKALPEVKVIEFAPASES
ncbi:MAG TPA: type VI secretion system accessory protein TagJ [Blastocatellia bacterium]|nr:type VI secretion system accessory protein TagJ [Blastocatellia bacterium]